MKALRGSKGVLGAAPVAWAGRSCMAAARQQENLRCNHHSHDALACGGDAVLAAAYPTALNDALVWALTGVPPIFYERPQLKAVP